MIKAWLDRVFRSKNLPRRSAVNDDLPDLAADMRRQIETDVAAGFRDIRDIVESAVEVFADDGDRAELRRDAERLAAKAFAVHAAAQASWPAITDCDRLDAAFSVLEADGIISRQNYSCCGNCGSAEIWDEIEGARKAGRVARGYTFYHMQDTDAAVDGYGICLNYGAFEEGVAAAVEIGQQVAAQLTAHGLSVDWDGRIERRIAVPLDWKRRRTVSAG